MCVCMQTISLYVSSICFVFTPGYLLFSVLTCLVVLDFAKKTKEGALQTLLPLT